MLGKHFIVGTSTYSLSPQEARMLGELQPLGIILFARNFSSSLFWREDLKRYISDVKEACKGSCVYISIDFEGGRVNRFPEDIPRLPYAQDYIGDIRSHAEEMAEILSSLGINLSYSPCVDLDLESTNPVIGKRAFADNSEDVIQAARVFIRSHVRRGIQTVLKHFPGHGRTTLDSHFSLPVVNESIMGLSEELEPYRQLAHWDNPWIMASHVLYPQLDFEFPASLSHAIIQGLLRQEMGFEGIVVTDDLDMKALAMWSATEKGQLALQAGVDVLLFGNGADGLPIETAYTCMKGLEDSISRGNYSLEQAVEASNARLSHMFSPRLLIAHAG